MRSTSCAAERARDDAGSTMVEFLGVTVLAVVCLLGLAQLAVWVWARDVAVSAAHEGARAAAERGRPLRDGIARTRTILHDGLGGSSATFAVDAAQSGGTVAIRAHGTAPVIVPFLPRFPVDVQATAFDEDAVLP
jgi:hypothetical protein